MTWMDYSPRHELEHAPTIRELFDQTHKRKGTDDFASKSVRTITDDGRSLCGGHSLARHGFGGLGRCNWRVDVIALTPGPLAPAKNLTAGTAAHGPKDPERLTDQSNKICNGSK
ncbi:hypothetical protein Taro_056299 [Colocasia esculenta]|uniref:Uncharacterized protein n=1 Tax=Colocasia esculenta TaxID=4460 RepID=A0A843XVC7_COLES|nr:hypothetical protein [Colocasia esculenta]